MAKDKERAINPAAAQRKLEKQKALKKGLSPRLHLAPANRTPQTDISTGKANVAAQRTERLARRNPDRLQRQIDELKGVEESGDKLAARDKKLLEELERDVGRVRKARETVGVPERDPRAPRRGDGGSGDGRGRGGRGGMLGKRRREDGYGHESGSGNGSDTDENVRRIPMPRDTPPPIPFPARQRQNCRRPENANLEPLGEGRGGGEREPHALPPKPVVQAQTVYEAKPAVRDLRKEAVSRFVPSVVARKLEAQKGQGRLLEPEELEALERAGYGGKEGAGEGGKTLGVVVEAAPGVGGSQGDGERGHDGGGVVEEEEDKFEKELRELGVSTGSKGVEMEEVEDEDL